MAIALAVLYALLLLALVVLSALSLEYDLYNYRNRRRGLYSFDWLSDHTGIFHRSGIEALVGPPREQDRLYEIPDSRLKALPRNRWVRGPYHPLLCAASLLGLIACAIISIVNRQPFWIGLASAGSYMALCIPWAVVWITIAEKTETDDPVLPELDWRVPDKPTDDTTIEDALHDMRQIRNITEGLLDREMRDGDNSPLWKWIFGRMLGPVAKEAGRDEANMKRLQGRLKQSLIKARWLKLRLQGLDDPKRREFDAELNQSIDWFEKVIPDEDRRPR